MLPSVPTFDSIFESPRVVFVTIWRHPINHAIAHWGVADQNFPEVQQHDYSRWQGAAQTNNYALRCILGKGRLARKTESALTRQDLEAAKQRMRNFAVIFIVEWFAESLQMACALLRWKVCGNVSTRGGGACREERRPANE